MEKSMQEEISDYINNFKQKADQVTQDKMKKAIDELENSTYGKGLRIGEKAPDFLLPNATGEQVQLSDALQNGPVILTFYRGDWCPYCNIELRAYQRILDDIHAQGASLIAISPQTPDNSLTTQEKNDLKFHVLSDKENKVASLFRLVYPLPDYLIELYKQRGLHIDKYNEEESWTLPVAATYIIAQDKTILFEFTKADYKARVEPSEVLERLKRIMKS
ncbi:peroxiredoxin-like family protein [Bacillus solimangrovi]|uniref:thioredoxin-dependent peroxiredoxin n=1 Tax=Bacillus solimangrovi TaxID=1305675 RepID=A0A1E5LAS5_9BACI|nr:peroxiredoxin-like family protein [Bacillus solimangrovi]OEH91200.1 alkyl hydroperoxide reductase [Bacillus solimangrovi]